MSAALIYRLPAKRTSLGDGLRFAMREKYFEMSSGWITIDYSDISFFEGVAAGTGNDETKAEAQLVIELIRKHDSIEMCLEY